MVSQHRQQEASDADAKCLHQQTSAHLHDIV